MTTMWQGAPWGWVVVAGLMTACSSIPMPRLPQVEQAAEATRGGGGRYRIHARCLEDAVTAADLIDCMRREGYAFVPQRLEYPSSECWEARNNEEPPDRLLAHCFEHDPAAKPPVPVGRAGPETRR
jgi:hypothetical protein